MHQLLFFGYMGSDPLKVGCQDEFLVSRLMLSFLHYWSEDSSILDALARFPWRMFRGERDHHNCFTTLSDRGHLSLSFRLWFALIVRCEWLQAFCGFAGIKLLNSFLSYDLAQSEMRKTRWAINIKFWHSITWVFSFCAHHLCLLLNVICAQNTYVFKLQSTYHLATMHLLKKKCQYQVTTFHW